MGKIRDAVRAVVAEKLRIHFQPLDPKHAARNKQIIELVCAAEEERSRSAENAIGPDDRAERFKAMDKLVRICPGDWSDTTGVDFVSSLEDSCNSRDDAVDLVSETFIQAFLSCRPPIPALNRWNRVYPPLVFWLAFLCFHGIIVHHYSVFQITCVCNLDVNF